MDDDHIALVEDVAEPKVEIGAAERLAAFEKEHMTVQHDDGSSHLHVHGGIEKGVGSPYANLSDQKKAHHTALEQLVAAEKAHAEATTAMAAADAALEAAVQKVSATEIED